MDFDDQQPFRAEYANAPIICDRCDDLIDEGVVCISKHATNSSFDDMNAPRFHVYCCFSRSKSIPTSIDDVEHFHRLRKEDQQIIRLSISKHYKHTKMAGPSTSRSLRPPPGNLHLDDLENIDENQNPLPVVPISKLEIQVQNLLTKIFDDTLPNSAAYRYQAANLPTPDFMLKLDKMPWGRLKHGHILEATNVLTGALLILEGTWQAKNIDLSEVSYNFHENITKTFGPDFSLPIINNPDPLFKTKLQVLKFFLDSQLGYLLLIEIDKTRRRHHSPALLDSRYINLQCQITFLEPISEMGQLVTKYFRNTSTYGATAMPGYYNGGWELENIFQVTRYDEEKRFEPYKHWLNRKLLWHGSSVANFVGILSTGLRISQANGGLFGRALYFADAVAKSIPYCRAYDRTVLLLLCEVALGQESEHVTCDANVKHGGQWVPDPSQNVVLDGTVVPCGTLIENQQGLDRTHGSLPFNEYTVGRESQCIIRYLVQLEMVSRPEFP